MLSELFNPSYSIRELYNVNDGFDYTLLVEDALAKSVVEKIIDKNELRKSRLITVVPVAGWENVLQLHKELIDNGVLGIGRKLISILDGDIQDEVPEDYINYPKLFLPIKSIEKFLLEILLLNPNIELKTKINDKYFTVESIDMVIAEYQKYLKESGKKDGNGKKLYFALKKNLEKRKVDEDLFIHKLCDEIMSVVDFSKFEFNLVRKLV